MNKTLLRKVAKRILRYPERYNQDNLCGTCSCIAGHALWIHDRKPPPLPRDAFMVEDHQKKLARAFKLLGLTRRQWWVTCFAPCRWPAPYWDRYFLSTSDQQRAQVAHDRIMHLIETGR